MTQNTRVQVNSAIASVQQLMAIIMGVGAANGLDLFFRMEGDQRLRLTDTLIVREGWEYKLGVINGMSTPSIVCVLLLMMMAFRFYHLNTRYLDDRYRDKPSTIRWPFLMFDFFFIFCEGILISSAGFFVDRPAAFFLLFAIALITDAIWAGVDLKFNQMQDRPVEARRRAKSWVVENGGAGILLSVIVYFQMGFVLAAFLMLLNSARSLLGFNRRLGFPDPSQP